MMDQVACKRSIWRFGQALVLALGVLALSNVADGATKRLGEWPASEKTISLDVRGLPRAQAIEKLADMAGWSVVLHTPPGDAVDLHVKGQRADAVLEMLLSDDQYVANRQGSLISISREAPAALAVPAVPAVSAAPAPAQSSPAPIASAAPIELPPASSGDQASAHGDGEDRVVTGGDLKVDKGETVHNIVLVGGDAEVYGRVTGNISVTGGELRIHDGAWVKGDIFVLGGEVDVDEGAKVEGGVGVIGGEVRRADKPSASVPHKGHEHGPRVLVEKGSSATGSKTHKEARSGWLGSLGGSVTRAAFMFLFGAIFLALASSRMERLQAEAAARPMRSVALGAVGILVWAVLLVVMCVTLIGIPFAVLAGLLGAISVYLGMCAVLTMVGGAILGHKTRNPYVHLALGCVMFLVLGAIPFVGNLVTGAVVLFGAGVMVATRCAGMIRTQKNSAQWGPYRSAPVP